MCIMIVLVRLATILDHSMQRHFIDICRIHSKRLGIRHGRIYPKPPVFDILTAKLTCTSGQKLGKFDLIKIASIFWGPSTLVVCHILSLPVTRNCEAASLLVVLLVDDHPEFLYGCRQISSCKQNRLNQISSYLCTCGRYWHQTSNQEEQIHR